MQILILLCTNKSILELRIYGCCYLCFIIRLKRLNLTTFLNQNWHKRIMNYGKAIILLKKYSPSTVRYQKLLSGKGLGYPYPLRSPSLINLFFYIS